MKKIGIIGNGPAGLFAAWAALQFNDTCVELIAPPGSAAGLNAGVFYLHSDMGLPLRSAEVIISGFGGDAHDYAEKLYGDPHVPVSFPESQRVQKVWDAKQAMLLITDIIQSSRVQLKERKVVWPDFEPLSYEFDLVVNTAPLSALGRFSELSDKPWSVPAWVMPGNAPADESYVLYSAHPSVNWYRCSAVFGTFVMESHLEPEHLTPEPGKHWRKVTKVIRDFPRPQGLPDNVILTGRFGSWTKSVLSDQAFDDAYDAIRRL